MKKTYNYSIFYLLLFSVGMLAGCVDDEPVSPDNIDFGDEVELTFDYTIPGMETVVKTRMTDEQEQVVADVRVFVYRVDGDQEIYAYNREAVLTGNNTEVSGSFRVRLAKSEADEKYTYDVLFNATTSLISGNPSSLSQLKPGITTRSEARKLLKLQNSSASYNSSLPMWAGIKKIEAILIDKNTTPGMLKLIRSVLRLDIGINLDNNNVSQGLSNFTLSSAAILYGPNVLYYIPDPATINSDGTVTGPTINPYDGHNNTSGIVKSTSKNAIIAEWYIFEPKVDHTSGIYKFTIVIGGSYTDELGNKTTQYYPIRLMDPNNPDQLLNMIRNHKYRINITSIDGPGYSSRADAAKGEPVNMIYDLSVSEEGDINHIVYNGEFFLGVSEVNYSLPGSANSTAGEIKVMTNYPIGWSVTLTNQDGTTIATNSNLIRLSTRSSASPGKTSTNINFPSSNNGVPQTYYAIFTAGALSIKVTIIKNGEWYISSNYMHGTYMNGEGDSYTVSVWGNVPPNLQVRAYSPLRDMPVSYDVLTYPGGIVSDGDAQKDGLNIMGNAWLPMAIRQVQFQYSTDGGVTWVTFEEGPQTKGHYRLKSTGRIVALYNMEDDNGNPLDVSWAEAMGLDSETDVAAYVGSDYNENHGNGHNAHGFGYNYDGVFPSNPLTTSLYTVYHNYDDVASRKTGGYLPSPTVGGEPGSGYPINGNLFRANYPAGVSARDGKTGCAIYNEDKYGFANQYPKGRWRLPSIRELEEMAEYEDHIGDLPLKGTDDNYWSSTEYARQTLRMQAIYFHFVDGAIEVDPLNAGNNSNNKSLQGSDKKLHVRCVFVPDSWNAPASIEVAPEYFIQQRDPSSVPGISYREKAD